RPLGARLPGAAGIPRPGQLLLELRHATRRARPLLLELRDARRQRPDLLLGRLADLRLLARQIELALEAAHALERPLRPLRGLAPAEDRPVALALDAPRRAQLARRLGRAGGRLGALLVRRLDRRSRLRQLVGAPLRQRLRRQARVLERARLRVRALQL